GAGEVEGGEGTALGVELVAARGQDGGFLGLGSVGDVGGAVEIQAGLVDGGEVDGDDEGVVVDGAVGAEEGCSHALGVVGVLVSGGHSGSGVGAVHAQVHEAFAVLGEVLVDHAHGLAGRFLGAAEFVGVGHALHV